MHTNAHDGEQPFKTLGQPAHCEVVVERSRFIAHALPVESVEQAQEFIAGLRREHHDARHVCYGLRVGRGAQGLDRSNDDGEPARTGGYPLWQLLEGEEVIDALVAVVRYFGGIKLGMGGLARAYREAGREAMLTAGIVTQHPELMLRLPLGYEQLATVNHVLGQLEGVRTLETSYAEQVVLTLGVRKLAVEEVRGRLGVVLQCHPEDVGALISF